MGLPDISMYSNEALIEGFKIYHEKVPGWYNKLTAIDAKHLGLPYNDSYSELNTDDKIIVIRGYWDAHHGETS